MHVASWSEKRAGESRARPSSGTKGRRHDPDGYRHEVVTFLAQHLRAASDLSLQRTQPESATTRQPNELQQSVNQAVTFGDGLGAA